ncbi:helix-turn-helix transcriptional regulator [Deinococcus aquaedulcis]|uniref:helix-turn-helix transcriptional regulator n=1 Tax=Deinococcus aquaedulcis TaxID=2840455 RepID=UPI001C833D85|nr:helix-turn-helix transcriptional regulator [Deinococcus aquaedulcis]
MTDQKKKSLSEWREARGITVQALADAVGITRGRMGDYLQGRTEPSVTRAQKFAELLNVTVDQVAWVAKPKTSRPAPPKKAGAKKPGQKRGATAPQEDAEGPS